MSKKDKWFAFILGLLVFAISFVLEFDYVNIASEGLTLSSIVLAVYVAAMMGLIGSKLGEKLANTPALGGEYTQLWILRAYFKNALFFAVATIVLSSLALLIPTIDPNTTSKVIILIYRGVSAFSLTVYAVNLFFMVATLKFMLNRQIWNT